MRSTVILLLVLAVTFAATAYAQTGTVAVYYDTGMADMVSGACPGIGVAQTLYVGAKNWNFLISGAQYAVEYPTVMTWLADVNTPPATIGTTPTGISMGLPIPENGFNTVLLHQILILWNCDNCAGNENKMIRVIPHPLFGDVILTDFPGFQEHTGNGLDTWICFIGPVENATWGAVKALYE